MHNTFSADLKAATASSRTSGTISKCFMKAKIQFLIYADYCSNLLSAQDLLDSLSEHSPAVEFRIKVSAVNMFDLLSVVLLLVVSSPCSDLTLTVGWVTGSPYDLRKKSCCKNSMKLYF